MNRRLIQMAAAGTAAAGFIHVAQARPHAAEALWLGAVFVATGLLQVVLACAMLRQGRPKTLMIVGLFNSAIIVGWGLSRTVGLPSGAGDWSRELPAMADVTATSLEALSILLVLLALPAAAKRVVKRSLLAGIVGLFLLSGSSALARTALGKTPLIPAHSHQEESGDHNVVPRPGLEEPRSTAPESSHPHE